MKQLAYCLVLFASLVLPQAVLAQAVLSQAALAQEAGVSPQFDVTRVGVIDLNYVLREAQAAGKIRQLLDEKRAKFELEFTEKEKELLKLESDLQAERLIVSEQKFSESVQEFQLQVDVVNRDIQEKRQVLDKAFQDAQDRLRTMTVKIVTEIAVSQDLDMVFFDKNSAIIFRQDLNITQAVLEQLNERTKNAHLISNDE